MVVFKGSLRFELWIEIQGCGRMGMMVLKLSGKDLRCGSNWNQKVFVRTRHDLFVVGSSIFELLFEILHMEEHCFGFMG